MLLRFALSSALIIGLLSACRINNEPLVGAAGAPVMVLRAYDAPAGQTQEIRNVISSLLWRDAGQPSAGRVVVAPNGQILLAAPAPFHEGVEQLMRDMKTKAPPTPAAIAIDYWLVRAGGDGGDVGDLPADAAAAVGKVAGERKLSLWDRTRLTSLTNEHGQIERKGSEFEQTASLHDKAVVADLKIKSELGRLELRATLPLDAPVVLAQAAAPEGASQGAVFYVLRASLAQ